MIYLKHLHLELPAEVAGYPFDIPALRTLGHLAFTTSVTFLVGENGSGKSTLLEGIGREVGFNVAGGNANHLYQTDQKEAPLADALRLSWFPRTHKGFFMRAESLFHFATFIDENNAEDPGLLQAYGGKSLHVQSHGESFLALFNNRFREGLFLLDEPEAALSPLRQLSLMRIIHDCLPKAQFIIATHSPILLAYPGARILYFDESGMRDIAYHDVPHVQLTQKFLDRPERYLEELFR